MWSEHPPHLPRRPRPGPSRPGRLIVSALVAAIALAPATPALWADGGSRGPSLPGNRPRPNGPGGPIVQWPWESDLQFRIRVESMWWNRIRYAEPDAPGDPGDVEPGGGPEHPCPTGDC